ncbi:hypothetical protein P7C70_g2368, partial [Phenoliferia sp. Uapishka_3]
MLALRTSRSIMSPIAKALPRSSALRSYATATDSQTDNPGPVTSSPISSKASYTPYFLASGALLFIAGYYSFNNKTPPANGAVNAIDRAMAPKTDGTDPVNASYTKRH